MNCGNLVEVEPAGDPRALLVSLELDELPRLRAVDVAGRGDRPAHVAEFQVEVVLLAVGVEGGLVEAVGERREQRHAAQPRPGLEVRQGRGRAHQVLALDLDPPRIAHAPDHRHVHLAGRIREFDRHRHPVWPCTAAPPPERHRPGRTSRQAQVATLSCGCPGNSECPRRQAPP